MKSIGKFILQGIAYTIVVILIGMWTKTTVTLFNYGWDLIP